METKYTTKDLYIAAYLLATHAVQFVGVEGEQGQKFFVFSPQQKAQELRCLLEFQSREYPTKTII